MTPINTDKTRNSTGKLERKSYFQTSEKPKPEELSRGISVPHFKDKSDLNHIMSERAGYIAYGARIFEGASNSTEVEDSIKRLFQQAREALGQGDETEFISCVGSLKLANNCKFLSGKAENEYVELYITSINIELNDSKINIGHYCQIVKDLESYIKSDERYRKAFENMSILALHSASGVCLNSDFGSKPWHLWSEYRNDDFDRQFKFVDLNKLKYKAPNWDEEFTRIRIQTYSRLLEKEKQNRMRFANDQVHMVFLKDDGMGLNLWDFFASIDKLAEKIGQKGNQEIEDYKNSVRKEVALEACGFHINRAFDEIPGIKEKNEKARWSKGSEPHCDADFAVKNLNMAKDAFTHLDENAKEVFRPTLDELENELTPHVLKAVEKAIDESALVEIGGMASLQKFLNQWQYWIRKNPELENKLNNLVIQSKRNSKSLREEYRKTKAPKILADIILGLPKVSSLSQANIPGEPYFVSNSMTGSINCSGCGEYVNMGWFVLNNPQTKASLDLPFQNLHALMSHPDARTELAEVVSKIERILNL